MMTTKPRYNAAYPLAAELVFADRLATSAAIFADAVRAACLLCWQQIGRSDARLNPNTDAADGRDISIRQVAGDSHSPALVKRVREYIRRKMGSSWSNLSRESQEKVVRQVISEISPQPLTASLIAGLSAYGEFGAVPAFVISEVRRRMSSALAANVAKSAGADAALRLSQINSTAAAVQGSIAADSFGLTDSYWSNYYQRYKADGVELVDLITGKEVTAEAVGAVRKDVTALADSLLDASVIDSAPALESAKREIYHSTAQDFQLIIRASADHKLAPGVNLPPEHAADLISIDIYEGNAALTEKTDEWISRSLQRIRDINAESLKRGIKVVQQGIREGKTRDWIAEQLVKEMEIPVRRARNIARNEIGNQAWNVSYTSAKAAGMRYYRWRGMLDERERKLHIDREGKAYNPEKPPTDGNPGQPQLCRCYPEWLFDDDDVRAAEDEITARNRS